MKKTLLALALVKTLATGYITGQTNEPTYNKSNIEFLETGESKTRKTRANLFYQLPLNSNVYSFLELYDNKGYFSKNMINTPLTKNTRVRTEAKISNLFPNHIGTGIEQTIKINKHPINLKLLPFWTNKDGYMNNMVTAGFMTMKNFPLGKTPKSPSISLSAFGEANIANNTWDYGELNGQLNIPTNQGKFVFGYGYNMINKGDFTPEMIPRLKVAYHPLK